VPPAAGVGAGGAGAGGFSIPQLIGSRENRLNGK
jgi:hypothetical protein